MVAVATLFGPASRSVLSKKARLASVLIVQLTGGDW